MTHIWLEWFMGRNEDDLRSYDFTEAHPVWKTWWFRIGFAAVCFSLLWFFWPG